MCDPVDRDAHAYLAELKGKPVVQDAKTRPYHPSTGKSLPSLAGGDTQYRDIADLRHALDTIQTPEVTYIAAFIPVEEGGYCIFVPGIDNCFTEADTIEAGIAMALDVIVLMLQEYRKENKTLPSPITDEKKLGEEVSHYVQDNNIQPTGYVQYLPININRDAFTSNTDPIISVDSCACTEIDKTVIAKHMSVPGELICSRVIDEAHDD